ncbi:ParB/RepB/Spo0J family partition protein [Paenibacillus thalictri]|uniref:ParB-like N-terminal domain-containing protein n=1 Tax=Paenibacillus thalictri TaxID=2527873 RepID=A0A4Q9DQ49_9BACL|nr:ParB/RepB/Spo0J family partition protein [Paenibacillus thalictri]TBL76116.1 hypothetical protein EYB31_21475 [Paenibacillus thalictri]
MENVKMIWASINEIEPNPNNPRGNMALKTKEMQQIIKSKGWETGITCYEKDSKYIIMSGHRRYYAAKRLKIKELPVILVEAPKTLEEELKRLWSVQGGKEDWTDYEWAKHTYGMWIAWEKCSFEVLSKKMGKSNRWVAERIRIFEYYPHTEIEKGFIRGTLNVKVLYQLIGWLDKLSHHKPSLVALFGSDMIRATLLQKIGSKTVRVVDLKNERFIRESTEEQIKTFLQNSNTKLSDCLMGLDDGNRPSIIKKISSHQATMKNIAASINLLNTGAIKNARETLNQILLIREELLKKQKELRDVL